MKSWIILKYDIQPPVLRCERCGKTETVILPAPVDDLLKGWKEFSNKHKNCKGDANNERNKN